MDSFLNLFGSGPDLESTSPHILISADDSNHYKCLPPEPQIGNIEYKLKLINPSKHRFEHLVTQLKWRLREGNGEAVYEIGVADDGALTGLNANDLKASLHTLRMMAERLCASTTVLRERRLDNGRIIAEALVRKNPDEPNNVEIRVAVLGNAEAGKSTLIGVLTEGSLDNGRGKARLNIFRHLHEIQSGRTSSISHEILGFNLQGDPINYSYSELMTPEQICATSSKLITFLDLAGHRKYIRTTIQGLSGYSPHLAMLVISAETEATGMAVDHLSAAIALNTPFFIVITKIDLIPAAGTLQSLSTLLEQIGVHSAPYLVDCMENAITATNMISNNVVPIFCVSSVDGSGLDLLLRFLYMIPANMTGEQRENLEAAEPLFQVDEHFTAGSFRQVIGGLLTHGVILEGAEMEIGPFRNGTFRPVKVQSIHRNRVPCSSVRADQSAAICLDVQQEDLRNGMVLLRRNSQARSSRFFQANICVLYHATNIHAGFQTTVFIGNIRQTAVIVALFVNEPLVTGSRGLVLFKFKVQPEYVRLGQPLLFREGLAKGTGEITRVFPLPMPSKAA